ncbi:RluA family pseudouridine synthase [Bacillus aquiflavi]|uniref:Pseudouridine synthase n=1 Tax=Bacillus aquiflavi TaxID=2672567 RepID=A0A6B3VZV8_9BACI|nr:RluA family pseudouridine synthase [Bacillus aquiflavi]MBA4537588.1 RluA family pseudouridine synthase [Bacillus aquiflavi]NEY81845.1 RluA family pseudouridine synthase [Bacillus aquiflavi]UAC49323.1 RluA family pseudouridine synthase [Bacillus aquiflavi]
MEKKEHTIHEHEAGERIDKVLSTLNNEWSRTQVQQWVKEGNVLVNGEKVKPNYKCILNDKMIIHIEEDEELKVIPEKMNLDIYFEDQDCIVVNKPRGMVVHPAPGHPRGTLINGVLEHCHSLSNINDGLRPGVVHRIDKDTSGLLMIAKTDFAHEKLVKQLIEKTVIRKYKAVVHGVIPHDYGTIDAPIGRDPKDRQRMAVIDDGKHAVTHFAVLKRFKEFTFVECQLETGRTHQIRVHMKYIGYPLAGDPKYGPRKTLSIEGQVLHAGILGFHHPRTGEYLQFEAPLPNEFRQIIKMLENNY